ncbi:MAG: hypothetical protein J0H48_03035 [Nitrosospira multiformis]|nr:hypothetical protein [Nitrosospira multiformis]
MVGSSDTATGGRHAFITGPNGAGLILVGFMVRRKSRLA